LFIRKEVLEFFEGDIIPCSSLKAVAEHSINLGCCIQLQNTSKHPVQQTQIYGLYHRETAEIELHPNNINKEDGFCLSKAWKPLIFFLKNCRNSLSQVDFHWTTQCHIPEDRPLITTSLRT
jgi:hypothetical protein